MGAALLFVEAVAAMLLLLRARRLTRSFATRGRSELIGLEAAVRQLRSAGAERAELLRPYRRLWRWYRHPLALAYRDSRRRRRA